MVERDVLTLAQQAARRALERPVEMTRFAADGRATIMMDPDGQHELSAHVALRQWLITVTWSEASWSEIDYLSRAIALDRAMAEMLEQYLPVYVGGSATSDGSRYECTRMYQITIPRSLATREGLPALN